MTVQVQRVELLAAPVPWPDDELAPEELYRPPSPSREEDL